MAPRSTSIPISSFQSSAHHPALHSFPTRRSSDLTSDMDSLHGPVEEAVLDLIAAEEDSPDRKSTRLNSSHITISYAVFCLKKKISGRGKMLVRERREQMRQTLIDAHVPFPELKAV